MHTSKAELPAERLGDYEGRMVDAADIRIAFEHMPPNFPEDPAAVFAGLPDDHCQCPHWGYLLKGSFRATYVDGTEEVVTAGEAYYLRPGHRFQSIDEIDLVEFSPVDAHNATLAQVAANLEALA